jgi:arylsulfatase A-like enzyme
MISAAGKPNLIVILADDLGYKDVGFNGCEDIPTPYIDSITQNGIRFTNGYVSFPVCGPSRAGLLTGRYQDRFGFTTNPTMDPTNPNAGLPKDEENIAQILNKVGYKSSIVGKWHMGTHEVNHPLNRGFDDFYGFLAGGLNYLPEKLTLNHLSEVTRKWEWYSMKVQHNRKVIDIDDYLTDELTDAGTRFIESKANSKEPFFLYLAYNAPHAPLQATEKYLSRFPNIKDEKRKTYAAMVSCLDDGVGRVLDTLRKLDIEDDTIIFFLSDNGGPESKNSSDNGHLKGGKSNLFEGGVRVPFAMQWTGKIRGGRDYDHPVISLDILATIADLTGVKIAEDRPLDGVNLVPYLTGEKKGRPHDVLFWRKEEQNGMAIRAGDIKLVSDQQRVKGNHELYDLTSDESEANNLSQAKPEVVESLKNKWQNWNQNNKDRYFPTLGKDEWWKRD